MRTTAIAVALTSLWALGVVACGRQPGESSKTALQAQAADVVPAGTNFTVQLSTPIGTAVSTPGQFFTAHLTKPLRNAAGQVLVKDGATIRGRIVGVERGPVASIQLDFQTLDAGHGPVPLSATIRALQGQPGAFSAEEVYSARLGYNAVILPSRAAPAARPPSEAAPPSGIGGGPSPNMMGCGPAAGVNLSVGTPIDMVLTRPLDLKVAAKPRS